MHRLWSSVKVDWIRRRNHRSLYRRQRLRKIEKGLGIYSLCHLPFQSSKQLSGIWEDRFQKSFFSCAIFLTKATWIWHWYNHRPLEKSKGRTSFFFHSLEHRQRCCWIRQSEMSHIASKHASMLAIAAIYCWSSARSHYIQNSLSLQKNRKKL